MRRACFVVGMVAMLMGSAVSVAEEWQTLFNGRDLNGWKANSNPESFRVEQGVLHVQAAGATSAHLFYVGEGGEPVAFKDFELEATVRAEPNSNGGIFVHTDMTTRDKQLHLAKGYEIQLNSSAKEKRKTGSLYAVVDLDTSPVTEADWFTIRVTVVGKHITVAIGDKTLVNYTEPDDVQRPKERAGRLFGKDGGAIALQAHDRGSVWYFKEIRIKRLP